MNGSFRAFMTGLIDYAGLFPPARLVLDDAVRAYARYLAEPDAWMLGRFIIPADRLSELDPYVPDLFGGAAGSLRLAVLIGGASGGEDLGAAADRAAGAMREFAGRHGGRIAIDVVETALGPETVAAATAGAAPHAGDGVAAALRLVDERLTGAGLQGLALFAEVAEASHRAEAGHRADARDRADAEDAGADEAAAAGVAAFNRERRAGAVRRAGLKLRCGGLQPAAFPAVERVARVIAACRDRGVPLKCTAGLHRPLRASHRGGVEGAVYHGFLNVFGAGILAHALRLAASHIEACLAEEDAAAFAFENGAFVWKERIAGRARSADAAAVAAARCELMTSFGSCSFDEPREDLTALGWLK